MFVGMICITQKLVSKCTDWMVVVFGSTCNSPCVYIHLTASNHWRTYDTR